jgi:two-component system NtrC family sensor kinase
MASVVRATKLGKNRRIGPIESDDELGELAGQFDDMLDRLQEHSRRLEEAAEQLEVKVQKRTAELSSRNEELEQTVRLLRETRRQLVTAEKLAALGELTAGVAHEINNPTAVILGHLDLLVSELGDAAEPHKREIDLIIEQVYRIRSIVNNLLQYARPAVYVGELQDVDVNALVQDTLVLVDHLLRASGAQVERRLEASKTIRINRQELQQVLVNLISNAAHAIARGGRV